MIKKDKGGPRQARPMNERHMHYIYQMPPEADIVKLFCALKAGYCPIYEHSLLLFFTLLLGFDTPWSPKSSCQRSAYAA